LQTDERGKQWAMVARVVSKSLCFLAADLVRLQWNITADAAELGVESFTTEIASRWRKLSLTKAHSRRLANLKSAHPAIDAASANT